ncbi:hypothetical protein VNO78_28588 [Psophocarpus tetragonolobus]|uniref:non-specific serine/threonine protein kinase n=1 Tax=Psophocarpus tetragonolobus TaxID=3891 RepID=A0AAN9RTG5_PSOTE
MGQGMFKALFCCRKHEIEIEESWEEWSEEEEEKEKEKEKERDSGRREEKKGGGRIGRILGKPYVKIEEMYKMKKELGRGQSGVTYLCEERRTKREYACKTIGRGKMVSPQEIEDVRREVMILQHLSGQPNIVEFRGAYEDTHSVHLVMELCSGGELFDRIIAKGNYSELEAASLMRQILNVLHVCHFMGVMHRDLKPENFLLASNHPDAPLKATDFGLSIFIEEGKAKHKLKVGGQGGCIKSQVGS